MKWRVSLPQAIAAAVCLLALLLALFPPAGLSPAGARMAALSLATIGLFATGALPEHVTALLFFAIAMLLQVAPAQAVFSGFESTAFWLVFGGLVIGVGIRTTGLAERLADAIARRLGNSYAAIIGGTVALGVALAFLMPSTMGRTLVLMPIVLAMAEGLGFRQGSTGRVAMVLAAGFGTMMPAFSILPATVPALVLSGASETLYGLKPVYGSYLALHFPVLGFLKAVALWLLILWLFPDKPSAERDLKPRGAMRGSERTMAVLLALALALWATDFLHGISPAWIGLAVAAICLLPFVAVFPAQAFNDKINYGSLFYVAGVLGLGVLVSQSGAGNLIAGWALAAIDLHPGEPLKAFASVVGLSAISAMFVTQPGVPVIMTPLAGELAAAAGLSLPAMLMLQVVGFSTVILPYQAPPLVVAMQLGQVRMADGNRLCLWLLAVTVFLLLPLDYFWWHALGWFG